MKEKTGLTKELLEELLIPIEDGDVPFDLQALFETMKQRHAKKENPGARGRRNPGDGTKSNKK